jgi:hypothetical protein
MTQAKRGAKSEVKKVADLVREVVDDGATTAEQIHKAIADLPLDVLERLDLFEETARNVRRIQDTSIGAIYDVIRKVDREVARLATEILERAAKARPRPKAVASKARRASATA